MNDCFYRNACACLYMEMQNTMQCTWYVLFQMVVHVCINGDVILWMHVLLLEWCQLSITKNILDEKNLWDIGVLKLLSEET